MGNLPITAHITVVSNVSAALPESSAASPGAVSPAGSIDFSNLLAGQIAAKNVPLLEKDVGGEAAGKLPDALPQAQTDVPVLYDNGGALLDAYLPVLPALIPNEAKLDVVEGESATHSSLGKRLAGVLNERPAQDLVLGGGDAKREIEDSLPANIAGRPGILPLAKEIEAAVSGTIRGSDHDFKVTSRAALDGAIVGDRNSAVFAHGVVTSNLQTAPATAITPTVTVESRVGAPAWGAELGQKVVWLANQQQQVAQINVTPPNLGPIQIHLNLASDQASAIFISPHAAVRDAIEAALPQLREMLAESGISLANADVSSQTPGQSGQASQESARQGGNASRSTAELDVGAVMGGKTVGMGRINTGQGLIDLFA